MDSSAAVFAGASLGLLMVVFAQISALNKRLTKLSRLDAKLDVLLKHAGLEFDPLENVMQEIIDALKSRKKIQAIRCYREASGVGLKEAKEYIEELQRRAGLGG